MWSRVLDGSPPTIGCPSSSRCEGRDYAEPRNALGCHMLASMITQGRGLEYIGLPSSGDRFSRLPKGYAQPCLHVQETRPDSVDRVENDPAIEQLGRRKHPGSSRSFLLFHLHRRGALRRSRMSTKAREHVSRGGNTRIQGFGDMVPRLQVSAHERKRKREAQCGGSDDRSKQTIDECAAVEAGPRIIW